ncbi:hypothetical protein HMPREF1529_02690 [Microbacterium sp. oral taxon 186 str. F0373]|nr:hypothetical protein HMPREF1529_02690 [Microbacterium sp. oral taxon 186 str. F0373]
MLGSPRRSSGRAGTGAADRDEPGPVTRSAAILRPLPRARHGPSVAPAATGAVQSRRVPGYVTATTPVETTGRSIRRRPRIDVERSNAARSDGRHPSRQRYAHVSSLQQHAQRSATDPAESAEHYGGAREPPVCEDVRHLHSAGGSPHPQAPTSHQRPDPVHLERRGMIRVERRSTLRENKPNVYSVALADETPQFIWADSARGRRIPKRPRPADSQSLGWDCCTNR